MNEWQPIETAPDNQTALFWVVPNDPTADGGGFLNMKSQIFWGKNRCWSSLLRATHWMPLPEPPALEAAADSVKDSEGE